jgi:hypothetical protein
MSFLRPLAPEEAVAETTAGHLIVELLNGHRYDVLAESWDEDEHFVNFESQGDIVAKFAKAQVLLICSTDPEEIRSLAA